MTHRVAVLDKDLCQPKKCGLECIKYCPVNKSGLDCITLNDNIKKAQIDEDLCNGCGICIKVCPFDAITIVNLASELSEHKIHQYDQNSFRLYKLPILKKGEVTGLLGRNGMGKSTVINIMSGKLIPNLGNYHTQVDDWQNIIKYYKGTEFKSYFEKLREKQIKISIKPQQVYNLLETFRGTGKELIEKYDETGMSNHLIKELNLKRSIELNVNELSGGELQRLVIATSISKDADLYFFDEPSSYNDIYQRTKVSRIIRDLARSGKTVMIVEHDVTLLDYISDYIDVMYGEPGSYGIVSGILSTKVGINVFLDGYLPNENVRFRDKKFIFDPTLAVNEFHSDEILMEYSNLFKSYKKFSVEIDKGNIKRGEIIGVIGANALGKTTMLKMITGNVKPDHGEADRKISISYKPQYLTNSVDVDVLTIIEKINNNIDGNEEKQILDSLKIKKLYNKSINNLSGGELQKVAIATTLLQKVDLFALDEPSAFLDVEDRITVSKFLQKFVRDYGKAAIVIDHDLQLIDLISDSIVIFDGVPNISGHATTPLSKVYAMNKFLKSLDISFRRDENSKRPRVNKSNSRLDKQQKRNGDLYYMN